MYVHTAYSIPPDIVSSPEKVVQEGKEAQALLQSQLTAVEADHKKVHVHGRMSWVRVPPEAAHFFFEK